MADYFADHRGTIQDLLDAVDAVTEIYTVKGAVRGNHVHQETIQWTYVVSGLLLVATQRVGQRGMLPVQQDEYGPRDLICDEPGVAHAWQALEDTLVLVFTKGPRSGEGYELDTQRLEKPLL